MLVSCFPCFLRLSPFRSPCFQRLAPFRFLCCQRLASFRLLRFQRLAPFRFLWVWLPIKLILVVSGLRRFGFLGFQRLASFRSLCCQRLAPFRFLRFSATCVVSVTLDFFQINCFFPVLLCSSALASPAFAFDFFANRSSVPVNFVRSEDRLCLPYFHSQAVKVRRS